MGASEAPSRAKLTATPDTGSSRRTGEDASAGRSTRAALPGGEDAVFPRVQRGLTAPSVDASKRGARSGPSALGNRARIAEIVLRALSDSAGTLAVFGAAPGEPAFAVDFE